MLAEHDIEDVVEEIEDLKPLVQTYKPYFGDTLNLLVSKASWGGKLKKEQVIKDLYKLYTMKMVVLKDPNPPKTIIKYAISTYTLWFWTVEAFLALTIASIYLVPQIYPFNYLRAVAGLILEIYIPGYVFLEALYPKKDDFGKLEQLIYSIGISIILVTFVGFVLNYSPWEIRLDPLTVSLTILVSVIGLIGIYRKYNYWELMVRAH